MKMKIGIKKAHKDELTNPEDKQFQIFEESEKQKLREYQYNNIAGLQSPRSPPPPFLFQQQSSQLQLLLQNKINFYTNYQPCSSRLVPIIRNNVLSSSKSSKALKKLSEFPRIYELDQLIQNNKQIYHLYSQKIEVKFDHCFLFYMDILNAAIKQQYTIKKKENSVLVECLLFLSKALLELGIEKLAYFFSFKGAKLCEMYGRYMEMGQMLVLMGQVTMKLKRFEDCLILLKKGLQYLWKRRSSKSHEFEIQTYSTMSQCLLQMNMVQQSKILAYKYEMGYTQKDTSKMIELSRELINSVQSKKNKWNTITKQNIQALLSFNIDVFINKNYCYLIKMDQRKIMDFMKINFQNLHQSFLKDEIFFYEISMPLQIVIDYERNQKIKLKSYHKYNLRTRTQSMRNFKNQTPIVITKQPLNKPKQLHIFNFRGAKISRQKLCNQFQEFLNALKEKLKNQKDNNLQQ